MKTLKLNLIFALTMLLIMTLASCGGDDAGPADNVNCNSSISVNNAISDEVEAISLALNNYVMDASESNCNELREAYQDYIDALRNLQDCANDAGVGAEFAQSLADAEVSIQGLVC